MKPKVGDNIELVRTIEGDDLEAFARLSLDRNKVHFDPEFAASTFFRKPIAHGMIGAALISGGLTALMGDGNIWLSANIEFKSPIYIGDKLSLLMTVEGYSRRGIADIAVEISNSEGELVISGAVTSMQTFGAVKS